MSYTIAITLDDDTHAKLVRIALLTEGRAGAAGEIAARLLADVTPERLERAEHIRRQKRIHDSRLKPVA